ncbi:class F sortase [Streptomyces sp. NPDC050416]|uniref:class F sortase n=1 Tax=Streptomyces sp. NPDC050416 TaxID=3365611 RepID=UPI0037A19F73
MPTGCAVASLCTAGVLCVGGPVSSVEDSPAAVPRDAGALHGRAVVPGSAYRPGPAAVPVRLRAAGGLVADLVPVATGIDGALHPPAAPGKAGWWALGASAGAAHGTLLVAGHVDTEAGEPGTFEPLGRLDMGTTVDVTGVDGSVRAYRVTARLGYPRQRLPVGLFSRHGPHRLALVTCGGAYDEEAGAYEEDLVLYATPVTARPGT